MMLCKECSRPLEPSGQKTKIFCSGSCRSAWHGKERTEGMRLLRKERERENNEEQSLQSKGMKGDGKKNLVGETLAERAGFRASKSDGT